MDHWIKLGLRECKAQNTENTFRCDVGLRVWEPWLADKRQISEPRASDSGVKKCSGYRVVKKIGLL